MDLPNRTVSKQVVAPSESGPVVRTKKWATRSNTGCLNCRRRRVKCDELRPTCAKCIKHGLSCRYDRYPAVVSAGVWLNEDEPRQTFLLPAVSDGLTGMQRHWLAAARCAIITNERDEPSVINSGGIPKLPKLNWKPDYTMMARIRGMLGFAVGRCQDHSPVVASCFGINDLATGKTLFSYYTGQILSTLVQDIQKPDQYLEKQLIARLGIMIYDDIVMSGPSLRTHLNGFMAAISAVGGLAKAIADGHIRPGIVQIFLVTIVMTNTTSPSHDQMQTESDFSYSDIYSYYSCAVVAEVPCPTVLFVCITDINRLRGRIAREEWEGGGGDGGGDGGGTAAVKKAANTILKHALAFQPGTWTERYKLPGPDIAHPIAAMFKHAVVLYGTRTLAGHAGIHVEEASRLAAARELLTAIKEATAKVGNFLGATWPLMVAGASLAGAAAEQEEVASLLNALTQQPNPSDGLWLGIECLRRFWASGKTEWDDCFSTWHTTVP